MSKIFKNLGLLLGVAVVLWGFAPTAPASAACNQLANDKGQAKYTIAIPEAATYTLWLRALAAHASDGVEVQVDNLCPAPVGTPQQTEDGFAWTNLTDGETKLLEFTLTPGDHTVVIAGRQVGAGIDRVQFVKGAACIPAGFGDNCLAAAAGQTADTDQEPTAQPAKQTPESRSNIWAVITGALVILGAAGFLGLTYYRFSKRNAPSQAITDGSMVVGGQPKPARRMALKLRAFVVHHKITVLVCAAAIIAGTTVCVVFAQTSMFAEGESGTLGGGAKIVDDTRASAGKYVMFETNPANSTPPNLAGGTGGGAASPPAGSGTAPTPGSSGGSTGGESSGGGSTPGAPSFPDANSTGWQHTGVTLHACSLPLVDPVYDSCLFTGEVNVSASNITVTRSKIVGTVNYRFSDGGSLRGLTLTDVEIDSSTSLGGASIGNNDYTCIRCHVHGGTRGANVGFNVTIKDSYLHGWYASPGDHITGIGSNGGANNVIDHNNISCDITNDPSGYACSSALSVYGDDPPGNDNWKITNNLLNSGSSYCMVIAGPPSKPYPYTNITVTGNTFGNTGAQYWSKPDSQCTEFGAISGWTGGATNTWSGNKDIHGSAINP